MCSFYVVDATACGSALLKKNNNNKNDTKLKINISLCVVCKQLAQYMRLSKQVTHLWQCQDTRKQKNNNICCVYGAHAHKRTLYSNKLLFF